MFSPEPATPSTPPRLADAPESLAPDPDTFARWDDLPIYQGTCRHYLLCVPREKIGYANAILESFGHLARVFTKEGEHGILQVTTTEEWDPIVRAAVARLGELIPAQFVDETELQ